MLKNFEDVAVVGEWDRVLGGRGQAQKGLVGHIRKSGLYLGAGGGYGCFTRLNFWWY
jgi:hypothetical protein